MNESPDRGRFITVEGQDGAGKTTNLERVERIVRESGRNVIRTREPGGTPLGDELRRFILHREDLAIDPMSELLLIFAARAQHLETVIEPALRSGTWVVCDRFTDATYAYQGGGRGVDLVTISELEQRVQRGLRPDLTLLLDVDIETGLERTDQDGDWDRFETEDTGFRERVRDAYLSRARMDPGRIVVVDAGQPLELVSQQVESAVRRYMDSLIQ